jgi:voltage-gated potassium channel
VALFNERQLERLHRTVASGRILPLLVVFTAVIAVAGALFVELLSPNSFDSLGDALWWAAQTVTTIGYGDVVPATGGGRVIALFVMFFGAAAVAVATALITAVFISYQQRRLGPEAERHEELLTALGRIEQRLAALERGRGH